MRIGVTNKQDKVCWKLQFTIYNFQNAEDLVRGFGDWVDALWLNMGKHGQDVVFDGVAGDNDV